MSSLGRRVLPVLRPDSARGVGGPVEEVLCRDPAVAGRTAGRSTDPGNEDAMHEVAIGDGVRVTDGPMQHQYGVVVFYREDDSTYLVRFGGTPQMYYRAEQMEPWA